MRINRILTLLGGLGLFVYEIVSILRGQTHGLAATGFSRVVVATEEPAYFWVSVIFSGAVGIMLIYSSIEKK